MLSTENKASDVPLAGAARPDSDTPVCTNVLLVPDVAGVPTPKPVPKPPPVLAEKLKPDAEPKAEGAAGVVWSDGAKEKAEAEGAGDEPNPGRGGAAEALPKLAEVNGVDTEPNPLTGAEKLKLLS